MAKTNWRRAEIKQIPIASVATPIFCCQTNLNREVTAPGFDRKAINASSDAKQSEAKTANSWNVGTTGTTAGDSQLSSK